MAPTALPLVQAEPVEAPSAIEEPDDDDVVVVEAAAAPIELVIS